MISDGTVEAVAWHSRIAARFDARYETSPAFRERAAVWGGLIGRMVDDTKDVLDVGCGPGQFVDLAASRAHRVLAFDASPEMVALARARLARRGRDNAEVRVGRLGDDTVIGDGRFDVVLCSSVLEYVPDLWGAIDWLAAALRPGGTAILSMPNGRSLYRKVERLAFRVTGRPAYYAHVRHVPAPADFTAGLVGRGFGIRSLDYYGASPVASPLLRAVGRPDRGDALFVVVCERRA